jgi:diacylglycerol O-acyltransferase / wax synthase
MIDQQIDENTEQLDASDAGPEPIEQLGGLDTMFLSVESPTMHMHVCGLLILDPAETGVADPYAALRRLLETRVPAIAPMRHRLVTVPFNLGLPIWADDPDLRLEHHVHRVLIDPPGDDRQLGLVAAEFASTQLRRDRPLWEMLFVEGLAGGRVALLVKMHHSTIDGVSGANILGDIFDLTPEPPPRTPPEREVRPLPNPLSLVGRALLQRLAEPLEIAKLVPDTVGKVGGAVWRAATRRGDGGPMAVPFNAPRTSFNGTITAERSVAFTDVSLSRVKALKSAHGVTVNDVLTAVVGGALRHYLAERGELPERPLIAAEPVSVHGQVPGMAGATQVSVMFANLATDVVDPLERLHVIAAANRRAKEFQAMVGADTLMQWAEHFWPNGLALGARLYSVLRGAEHHPVIHNLILSNVPGPPIPLYLGGMRLVGLYPLGPIMDGAGLNVTVISQEDRVGFGILACPDLTPDVWDLAEAIPSALAEIPDH